MQALWFLRNLLLLLLVVFCIAFSRQMYADDYENILITAPEYIAEQAIAEDQLIYDVFSPISGQPCLGSIDLVAKGAQNINLSRIYSHLTFKLHLTRIQNMIWSSYTNMFLAIILDGLYFHIS